MFQTLSDYIATMYDYAQDCDTWWGCKAIFDQTFGAIEFASSLDMERGAQYRDYWLLVWKPLFEELMDELDNLGR